MTRETAAASAFVMDSAFWTATIIFLLAYAVIVSEKIHKTIVALIGAGLMLALKILDQHEAFHTEQLGVDWNVIFLLVSMMVIVNLMRPTAYSNISRSRAPSGEKASLCVFS